MIVVDANLLAYLVVEGAHTAVASDVAGRDDAWAAPRLWRSELMSALSGYVRRGDINVANALRRFSVAETAIGDRGFDAESADVLQLAVSSGCSTYDCEYVAVARALGVPLVTADKQIRGAFPRIAVSPEDFVKR